MRRAALASDEALGDGPHARGARKLLVSERYEAREVEAVEVQWRAPRGDERAMVVSGRGGEVAVFTERAIQQRHRHREATEIYSVIEGTLEIEVDGARYTLEAGDMIVVAPGAAHEVLASAGPLLCRVISFGATRGGADDKEVVAR